MTRFFLLSLVCLFLLITQFAHAQFFNKFESGTYILASNPKIRLSGQLKLRNNSTLLVKNETGKTLKLLPAQVASFRVSNRKYITTSGINGNDGFGSVDSVRFFVEQLDSGKVMLLRWSFQQGLVTPMGANGAMLGGGSTTVGIYLLQWPNEEVATPADGIAYLKGRQNFQESMRPFFISRPDILKLLEEKVITAANLPAAVHALNNNLPLKLPL